MSKIQILPTHLVNKIAAGECIERPASVLKELVENSIDSGATKIDVHLEQGGCNLIRVTDNGCGIEADDLPLAITPHATSKLQNENGLWELSTMGFRGEALPSIGSVAVLKISSIVAGNSVGGSIEVNGGQIGEVVPHAGADGTSIEVHTIFFNTPARRKFLKTPTTELNHCQEQLIKLALAYPHIGFTLTHGKRTLQQLPAGDSPKERIGNIFGSELAEPLIQVFTERSDITFNAYVSPPSHAKSSANWQYFFVNKRCIRDRFIGHALKEAFRGLMPHDRQPVGFLFLEINPSMVDVNVHPAKSEVRFENSGMIHSLVLGGIRDRFLSADLTAELTMGSNPDEGSSGSTNANKSPQAAPPTSEHQQQIQAALNDFFKSSAVRKPQQPKIHFTAPASHNSYSHSQNNNSYKNNPPTPAQAEAKAVEAVKIPERAFESQTIRDEPEPITSFIQIHNSYLVVETLEGLMIIDQHALHERVLYEKLRTKVSEKAMPKQPLLVPDVVNLTPAQMAHVEEIRDALADVGVDVEPFGPQSLAIQSLPAIISHLNAGDFIEDLLSRIGNEPAKIEAEKMLEHILQSLACKGAVKAGDPLAKEEILALLKSRDLVEKSSACPHGRPTTLKMSLSDLKKQFKRT